MSGEKPWQGTVCRGDNSRRGAICKSEVSSDIRNWSFVLYGQEPGQQARRVQFKRLRKTTADIVRILMRRDSNKAEQRKLRDWLGKNAGHLPELMRLSSKGLQRAILRYLPLVDEEKIRRGILRVAFGSNDADLHSDACFAVYVTRTDGTEFLNTIRRTLALDRDDARSNALQALSMCRLSDSERIKLVTPYVGTCLDHHIIEALRPLKRCRGHAVKILDYLRYRTTSSSRREMIALLRTLDVPNDFLQEALATALYEPSDDVFFEAISTIEAIRDRLDASNDRGRLLLRNLQYVVNSTAERHRRAEALLRKLKWQLRRQGSRVEARGVPNQLAVNKIADSCPYVLIMPVGSASKRRRKK